ncbi:hypothetical protein DFH11DRAFT_1882871 [Phellopilus nigrolimitatus]|nr:hypothetical protein DFH11DRAFT_1882871 [Phellopilus nigrolimitatus]
MAGASDTLDVDLDAHIIINTNTADDGVSDGIVALDKNVNDDLAMGARLARATRSMPRTRSNTLTLNTRNMTREHHHHGQAHGREEPTPRVILASLPMHARALANDCDGDSAEGAVTSVGVGSGSGSGGRAVSMVAHDRVDCRLARDRERHDYYGIRKAARSQRAWPCSRCGLAQCQLKYDRTGKPCNLVLWLGQHSLRSLGGPPATSMSISFSMRRRATAAAAWPSSITTTVPVNYAVPRTMAPKPENAFPPANSGLIAFSEEQVIIRSFLLAVGISEVEALADDGSGVRRRARVRVQIRVKTTWSRFCAPCIILSTHWRDEEGGGGVLKAAAHPGGGLSAQNAQGQRICRKTVQQAQMIAHRSLHPALVHSQSQSALAHSAGQNQHASVGRARATARQDTLLVDHHTGRAHTQSQILGPGRRAIIGSTNVTRRAGGLEPLALRLAGVRPWARGNTTTRTGINALVGAAVLSRVPRIARARVRGRVRRDADWGLPERGSGGGGDFNADGEEDENGAEGSGEGSREGNADAGTEIMDAVDMAMKMED